MAGAKYGKYVVKEPKGSPMQPRTTRIQSISLTGANYGSIAALNMDFNFVGIVGSHVMNDPPHKHDVDEMLFFVPGMIETWLMQYRIVPDRSTSRNS